MYKLVIELIIITSFSSVQFSRSVVSDSLQFPGLQHTRLPCPSLTPGVCSNLCPLSQWCHPAISSFVVPFSSCLQSFPASGSFQRVSSSHQVAKVLELQLYHQSFQWIFRVNFLWDWPEDQVKLINQGQVGWISLQSKRPSRVFANTTGEKHQFFRTQLSLWPNSHIHTWLPKKT